MPSINDLPKKRSKNFKNGSTKTEYKSLDKRALIKEFIGGGDIDLTEADETEIWDDENGFWYWLGDDDMPYYSNLYFFEFQNASDFSLDIDDS